MPKMPVPFLAALVLGAAACAAQAQSSQAGAIAIGHPYARATAEGQRNGGGYLSLDNRGAQADRLTAVRTDAAQAVELHEMAMEGDVMRMRRLDAIEVPAGRTVVLKPGGLHLMLVGLKAPLKAGARVPLTLTFARAGEVEVVLNVEAAGTAAAPAADHAHPMKH